MLSGVNVQHAMDPTIYMMGWATVQRGMGHVMSVKTKPATLKALNTKHPTLKP